jgi:predicted outer membrane protein
MAKDVIHNAIRIALENDGWEITKDPFTLNLMGDDTFVHIDMSAQKSAVNKSKNETIVAIEVKSFTGVSVLNAFHEALGQFLNYRDAIREHKLSLKLYLAVSEAGWDKLNSLTFVQRRIKQYRLKFVIIDIQTYKVIKWIK